MLYLLFVVTVSNEDSTRRAGLTLEQHAVVGAVEVHRVDGAALDVRVEQPRLVVPVRQRDRVAHQLPVHTRAIITSGLRFTHNIQHLQFWKVQLWQLHHQ